MKKTSFLFLSLVLIFAGCSEKTSSPVEAADPAATSFKELKPQSSFNWQSTKTITVTVVGFEVVDPVSRTLVISSPTGHVLHKEFMSLSETVTVTIVVPVEISSVKVTYGTIVRESLVTAGTALVNLAPPDDFVM